MEKLVEKKVISQKNESPTELVESPVESSNWEDQSNEMEPTSLEDTKIKSSEDIVGNQYYMLQV